MFFLALLIRSDLSLLEPLTGHRLPESQFKIHEAGHQERCNILLLSESQESLKSSGSLWIINSSKGDWHRPRKGTWTAGMAGKQIGHSDRILIVPQGVRTISAIVIAKMQHNRSSFSRVLKQTMIMPNRSRRTITGPGTGVVSGAHVRIQ